MTFQTFKFIIETVIEYRDTISAPTKKDLLFFLVLQAFLEDEFSEEGVNLIFWFLFEKTDEEYIEDGFGKLLIHPTFQPSDIKELYNLAKTLL